MGIHGVVDTPSILNLLKLKSICEKIESQDMTNDKNGIIIHIFAPGVILFSPVKSDGENDRNRSVSVSEEMSDKMM